MALPEVIPIKRLRIDNYTEIFTLGTMPAGASFVLQVGSFTPISGSVAGNDVSFVIGSDVANASPGTYTYEIVMTVSGKTRTIVESDWQVVNRRIP